MRQPRGLVSSAPWSAQRVVVRHGGCARANGRAAATRRLGVTSGTGAAAGALFASGTKEPAAEDEQT